MERLALIRLDLYPFILIKVHKTGYALRMRPQKNRITMSIAKIKIMFEFRGGGGVDEMESRLKN